MFDTISKNKIGRPSTRKEYCCQQCGVSFSRPFSAEKKGRVRFCGRPCSGAFFKGKPKKLPDISKRVWRVNSKGYLETTVRRKRIYQHRYIMEQYLNRPLLNTEFVHHINGVKTDNAIANLVIVDSKLHSREHQAVIVRLLIAEALLRESLTKETDSNLLMIKITTFLASTTKEETNLWLTKTTS